MRLRKKSSPATVFVVGYVGDGSGYFEWDLEREKMLAHKEREEAADGEGVFVHWFAEVRTEYWTEAELRDTSVRGAMRRDEVTEYLDATLDELELAAGVR